MLGSPKGQDVDALNSGVFLKCLLLPSPLLPFLLPFFNTFEDTSAGVLVPWKYW